MYRCLKRGLFVRGTNSWRSTRAVPCVVDSFKERIGEAAALNSFVGYEQRLIVCVTVNSPDLVVMSEPTRDLSIATSCLTVQSNVVRIGVPLG